MSYVPASNYQITDASNDNHTNNISLYSIFPYFNLANQLTWPCSWNASGDVQNPYSSWTGTITYSGTSSVYYGSGGNTQSCNLLSPTTPTSGAFNVTGNQVGSTVNSGKSCTATGQTWTFIVKPVLSNITFLSATYAAAATNVILLRLPPVSSSIGQVFYICNYGQGTSPGAAVCSYANEPIDGVSNSAFRLVAYSCIALTPNTSGTYWSIVSYYGGNKPTMGTFSVNGTAITSPVVTNIGGGVNSKLPNPATWGNGNFLYVTTYQTSTSAYASTFGLYTDGYFRQDTTANKYFSVKPASDSSGLYNHNMSIVFINDGTWWYIASVFDGQNCQIDAVTQSRTHITSPIFITASSDGGNTDLYVPVGGLTAMPMYFKMYHASSSNGFVINSSGWGGGYVCAPNVIRCYKNTGVLNYNAFAMLQAGVSSTIINFPVGMYPSAF